MTITTQARDTRVQRDMLRPRVVVVWWLLSFTADSTRTFFKPNLFFTVVSAAGGGVVGLEAQTNRTH